MKTAGDVVEVVQDVADGARNVTGAAGQAAWDAGPGTVSWALGMSPFESDQKAARWIDGAERRLQQAWGADTESQEHQGTNTAGPLAATIFGGKKFTEAAEGW